MGVSPSDGVVAIAAAIRSGQTTATDVVGAHLSRAHESQSRLNAFTMFDDDRALAAAADIDRAITAGDPVGPLAGVPIGVKDLIDHAGRPNTCGSSFEPVIPTRTATALARLESAGAVVIGRTGLHEYAFGFSSENHWFGPVRNPWDPTLSPGGSSGGSGAAVAVAAVAGALGTDTGGSVRVPAALCGVVGLKVTHGRIPISGVFPLAASVDTVGPLARSVADAAALYSVMAGYDPSDPWSAPRPVIRPEEPVDLSTITLGVPHPWVDLPTTADVAAAFRTTIDGLRSRGATVKDLDLPDLVPSSMIELSIYPEVATVHRSRWDEHPEMYGPDVSKRLGEVFELGLDDYVRGRIWRAGLTHTVEHALTRCDFIVTPTVAATRKTIGREQIDMGSSLESYRPQLSRFTALVNQTGSPAIALPLDMPGAPPPSLQVIGARWAEARLLEFGLALERAGISSCRPPKSA